MSLLALFALASITSGDCDNWSKQPSCADQHREEWETTFGAPPIDQAAANGPVMRVYFWDGIGRSLALAELRRDPGSDPAVRIFAPAYKGASPMEARLSDNEWAELSIFWEAMNIPAAPPELEPDEIRLCVHSWSIYAEARNNDDAVFRRYSSACDNYPNVKVAYFLAGQFAKKFPACASLQGSNFANAAELLGTCASFAGDRAATASAFVQSHGFSIYERADFRKIDVTRGGLLVNGQKLEGGQAQDAWDDLWQQANLIQFLPYRYHGIDPLNVKAFGRLWRRTEGNNGPSRIADLSVYWQRAEIDLPFYVQRVEIGPWRPSDGQPIE